MHGTRVLHFYINAIKYNRIKSVFDLKQIRLSSQYRRSTLTKILPDQMEKLRSELFANRTELSSEEWVKSRQQLMDNYKHINQNNVDYVMMSFFHSDNLLIAKNYVNYLQNNGIQPNPATFGRLLRIYNMVYHARGATDDALHTEEQEEILKIYDHLRKTNDILDSNSCENLIHGLVTTKKWLEAKELLDMMKITSTPTVGAYTEVICKAFSIGDMDLGFRILEDMLEIRKQPKCEIFLAYINKISETGNTNFKSDFEKMLNILKTYEIEISEKVVNRIEELANDGLHSLIAKTTKLNQFGKCQNCSNYMELIEVSTTQFAKLRDSFLNKVLIRNDVFQKSTPEEVNQFKEFLEKTGPYDSVIDGLNVAFSIGAGKSPTAMANLILSVVNYFKNQNKKVLVLGRKHMNKWPKNIMQSIRRNANIFLANNLSYDDPFLLYATLRSGPTADFFSRDLMRSHSYLLGPELKPIFRRWQLEHQYSLITQADNGRIVVKEPVRHSICAHKIQNHWHLPYKTTYSATPVEQYDIPDKWLCLKFQT